MIGLCIFFLIFLFPPSLSVPLLRWCPKRMPSVTPAIILHEGTTVILTRRKSHESPELHPQHPPNEKIAALPPTEIQYLRLVKAKGVILLIFN